MSKPKGPPRPGRGRPGPRSRPGVPAASRPSAVRRPAASAPEEEPEKDAHYAKPEEPSSPELEMRPLGSESLEREARPTATSFFSRPLPGGSGSGSAESSKGPAVPGRASLESGASAPPSQLAPTPIMPGTPMNVRGGAPMGIQGPVASGPVASASPSPMESQGGDSHSNRAKSWRLYGAILGVMTLLLCSGVLAVSLHFLGQERNAQDTLPVTHQSETSRPSPVPQPQADTAAPVAKPAPPPAPQRRPTIQPAPVPRAAPAPRPQPAPAPAPVAAPTGGVMPVTVTISGDNPFTRIVVTCETSRFSDLGRFTGGTAVVPGVPQDDCRILFKGASSASYSIRGGGTFQCSSTGGGVTCQ